MERQVYEALDAVQDVHWWYSARRRILSRVLERLFEQGLPSGTLYDLGCGVGANLPVLEKFGPTLGVDMSPAAIEYCQQKGRRNVVRADLNLLQGIPDGSGSVVVLADVIEHLEDEQPCLEAAHRALAPGGALIVTVPAYRFLWSPADDIAHHHRRYTAGGLRRVLEPRFTVEHMSYFNTLLFGLVLAGRVGEKVFRRSGGDMANVPPGPVNAALDKIFGAEAALVPRLTLPFGVSVLSVARKH